MLSKQTILHLKLLSLCMRKLSYFHFTNYIHPVLHKFPRKLHILFHYPTLKPQITLHELECHRDS